MSSTALKGIRKKRPSVTDSMTTNAAKILSGVERKLIQLLDSEADAVALQEVWPAAPGSCLVVVPGAKGDKSYIYLIRERLKAEGFKFDGEAKMWYRRSFPGQLTLEQKAALA
jgi:hypothetical protein